MARFAKFQGAKVSQRWPAAVREHHLRSFPRGRVCPLKGTLNLCWKHLNHLWSSLHYITSFWQLQLHDFTSCIRYVICILSDWRKRVHAQVERPQMDYGRSEAWQLCHTCHTCHTVWFVCAISGFSMFFRHVLGPRLEEACHTESKCHSWQVKAVKAVRHNNIYLWLFNIAMENGPFIDDFPIKASVYQGFAMAMLNNQMVIIIIYSQYYDYCILYSIIIP